MKLKRFTRHDSPPKEVPFEVMLRRFKKKTERAGTLNDLREKEFYEKPSAKRKRQKAAAVKRWQKQLRMSELPKKNY